MPAGWVSTSCGSGVRATDHRPELCCGGSWCYDITCAVQQVSYSRCLFHTTCPANTRVPLLRRAHAEQPQPGLGAFYRNRLRGRQRGWRGRCEETRSLTFAYSILTVAGGFCAVRDTSNRKQTTPTVANDRKRVRVKPHKPSPGFGVATAGSVSFSGPRHSHSDARLGIRALIQWGEFLGNDNRIERDPGTLHL